MGSTVTVTSSERAASAYKRELDAIGVELEDAEEAGRRAALITASDQVWRDQLGPLYSTRQVSVLMGNSKQAVSELARRKRILALSSRRGPPLFPAFQFGRDGRPLPGIPQVIAILAPVVATPFTIASFLSTAQAALEGQTPARWLKRRRPLEPVLASARRQAARLSR